MQVKSQLWAWLLLLLMVVIGTGVMCKSRCCDKYTFLDNVYVETYWPKEDEETKKRAAKEAEESARNFVAGHNFPEMRENRGRQHGNRNDHRDNETEIDSGIVDNGNTDNGNTDNGNLNSRRKNMGPESKQISMALKNDQPGNEIAEPGPSSSSRGDDSVKKDGDTS